MKNKHILIISQHFYPEQFRINDLALHFKQFGHKVTVLTGIPNYPEGKFYNGYGLFKKRKEIWNDIEIIRIPLIPSGQSSIQLIMNYYSFVFSGLFWSMFSSLKPDLIFSFETSPMIQTLIGKWFSKRRKIPHYLYVQDLWPESLEAMTNIHNKLIINHYQNLSDKVYRSCKNIFTTSLSLVSAIQKRIDNKEIVLYLPQYAPDVYVPSDKRDYFKDDKRFKIIFTGNVGNAQGLDILPKVAKLVKDDVCFVIVGNGRYKDKMIKECENVKDKFIFIDRQPEEKIPELLASCDAAYLSFMNNPLFEMLIPAKLQSYMACGMPMLVCAEGESKRIVLEANCGLCSKMNDAENLKDTIYRLKEMNMMELGNNSLNYSKEHFDKNKLMAYLDKILFED